MTLREKQISVSKGYWNPKRKLRVTTHFSETKNINISKKQEQKKKSNVWDFFQIEKCMVTPNWFFFFFEIPKACDLFL